MTHNTNGDIKVKDIDKDHFQYKLTDFFFKSPSKNLCVYFWQCAFAWVMVAFFVVAATSTIVTPFFLYFVGSSEGHSAFLVAYISIGIIVWLAAAIIMFVPICIVLGEGVKRLWYKVSDNRRKNYVHRGDGVVVAYIKAKKRKMCPRLNFVSSKENNDD